MNGKTYGSLIAPLDCERGHSLSLPLLGVYRKHDYRKESTSALQLSKILKWSEAMRPLPQIDQRHLYLHEVEYGQRRWDWMVEEK